MDANERITGARIIQKAKVKIQNCKLKVKSSFVLLFNLICQLADRIIPVAVIPELNLGWALTKVSF